MRISSFTTHDALMRCIEPHSPLIGKKAQQGYITSLHLISVSVKPRLNPKPSRPQPCFTPTLHHLAISHAGLIPSRSFLIPDLTVPNGPWLMLDQMWTPVWGSPWSGPVSPPCYLSLLWVLCPKLLLYCPLNMQLRGLRNHIISICPRCGKVAEPVQQVRPDTWDGRLPSHPACLSLVCPFCTPSSQIQNALPCPPRAPSILHSFKAHLKHVPYPL